MPQGSYDDCIGMYICWSLDLFQLLFYRCFVLMVTYIVIVRKFVPVINFCFLLFSSRKIVHVHIRIGFYINHVYFGLRAQDVNF